MTVIRGQAVQALSVSTAETAVDDLLATVSGFREWEIADDAFTNIWKDCAASMLKRVSSERVSYQRLIKFTLSIASNILLQSAILVSSAASNSALASLA